MIHIIVIVIVTPIEYIGDETEGTIGNGANRVDWLDAPHSQLFI